MNHRSIEEAYNSLSRKPAKYSAVFLCVFFIICFFFYGCGEKPTTPAPKAPQTKGAVKADTAPSAPQQEAEAVAAVEDTPEQEGYIYQQRDRRDPFVPLIVPKKKAIKIEGTRAGTLVSYDVSDFTLAAIAQKGGQSFALLTTPDNRSFTVSKGTAIGINKGKVQEITKNKVIIVEYSNDYRGEIKPRQIILEFHKGEVE